MSVAARHRMHAYYAATITVGLLLSISPHLGWAHGVGLVVVGVLALRARVIDDRRQEAIMVRLLAVLALVQGVWTMTVSGIPWPVAVASGLRIAQGPLQMWDWAAYRERALTAEDVRAIGRDHA